MKNSSQSTLDYKQAVLETGKLIPVLFAMTIAVGAPPTAALVTAGIGGVVLMISTLFSGAVLSSKGPSLVLLIVVASAIAALGYPSAIGVFFMAGLLQALLGVTDLGKMLLRWLSPVATKGIFVGLAVMLVLQQTMVWFSGTVVSATSLLDLLWVMPTLIHNDKSFMIGFFAISLLVIHQIMRKQLPKDHWSQQAPVSIAVVALVVVLSYMLGGQSFMTTPTALWISPSFSLANTAQFWYYVVLLAVCGSMQTFNQRQVHDSELNVSKNIFMLGLANAIISLFGGLPMKAKSYRPMVDDDLESYGFVRTLYVSALMIAAMLLVVLLPIADFFPVVAGSVLLLFAAVSYIISARESVYNTKTTAVFSIAVASVLLTNQPLLALLTATMVHKLWDLVALERIKAFPLYAVTVEQKKEEFHMNLTPTAHEGNAAHLIASFDEVPETVDLHITVAGLGGLTPQARLIVDDVARTRTGKLVLVGDDEDEGILS